MGVADFALLRRASSYQLSSNFSAPNVKTIPISVTGQHCGMQQATCCAKVVLLPTLVEQKTHEAVCQDGPAP